ncbi:TPA: hypothetical protein ACH3X1_010328 [Trebouxia sp. C0004]
MKSVACLRPAACSQQPASFSVLKEPAKTYTSRVALICRPALSGRLPTLNCHLPRSSRRKVTLTVTAARSISDRQVYHRQPRDQTAWPEPCARSGFQIPWQNILRVLLLIPVFILPAFLPSFPQQAHAARAAPTHTVEVWPANHGPVRQASTVSEGSEHRFTPAHTSPVVVDHSNIRGGFVDDTPRGHSSPVAEVQQTFAESPSTRVAVFVSCGVALLFLLRTTHLRHAAASNDRQMQNWREQDAGDLEPNASPAFAAAAVGATGRVLPVEERQAKAKEDIAAAKARQAAFASQGSLQFTDVDIAKPDSPDISSASQSSPSSAIATVALDDAKMPSASQLPGSGRSQPSSQPAEGSATGTFVLDKGENEQPTDGSAIETFDLGQGDNQAEDDNPTDTFVLESGISQGSSGRSRQPSVYEPDTSKPSYTQGRADLKPRVASEHDARANAQAQLQKQQKQKQTLTSTQPVADSGETASVFEPDTSKPLYTTGRADLKPRAADEQKARQAAQAELKAKSLQTFTPNVSAADVDKKLKAERSAVEQSPAESDGGQSDTGKPAPVFEPDTSKPLYTTGRADLKPRAADEQKARQAAQAELKAKSSQTLTPDVSAADVDKKLKAERSAVEQSPAESDGGQSDTGKPAPVFEPDTSKPLYTTGRADLEPRAADEQKARQAAQAELKARSSQTFTPDASAADAVKKLKAEQSPAESDTGKADATSSAEMASTSAGQQSSSLSGASSKPIAGGRAPAGEHDAREKAMAELKAKSQQQQPVTGVSSLLTASDKQQGAASQQQKPMSDQGVTSDLATSLSGASMSAKPELASCDEAVTAAPRSPPQTRPLQAQQAASFTPSAPSSASPFAPSQQEVQNPLQGLLTAFQGLLGGQSPSTATPSTTSSGSSGVGAEQARPVPLTAAQQAQWTPADKSALQMAASNQALATGKGQPRTRREVPVKRYAEVSLPGNVTEYVRARGLRAPLILLAGLAASAAQTLEPLWSVQGDSRGRKRQAYSDDEPLDWDRYRKYDVFNDLLSAAAASPAAQGEQFSPFRALANAVPQEGVPKYDFLRNVLQSALSSPASAPDTGLIQGFLRASQRVTGPDGKAIRSKYDPFNALLQRAQEDPSWPSEGPGLDPLAAAFQDASEPWYPLITKYDPFQALFNAQDPTGSSAPGLDPLGGLLQQARQRKPPTKACKVKLDPFQSLFKDSRPSKEVSPLDPVGNLLENIRQPRQQSVVSKYDPFQALFKTQGPGSDASTLDPLGNLLQSVPQAKMRSADSSKYDVFQALFKADGPSSETSTLDPLGNLLQSVRQAKLRSTDSNKYNAFQALFRAEGPNSETSTLDPLGNLLQSVRQAKLRSPDSNKYDAFQALFRAEGPSSETSTLDPLGNLLQSVRQTKLRSPDSNKYDVFQAVFNAEGPSSETAPLDPVGNLLQNVSHPRQTPVRSKYDPFQAIFDASGPSEQAPALDPLGALLKGVREPWTSVISKYDPFQAMFSAEAGSGDAQLDPLPHVMRGLKARAQLALHRKGAGPGTATTRLDKYDLVYQILSSQPASGAVPGFDPVGSLLKSSWLKEPSTRQKQLATDRSAAGFAQTRDRGSVSQQAARPSQAGRALGNEHQARQQAQADFMRRARQPAAASGFEVQAEGPEEADRPSEWAGFVYNPYSGDLLPPEDDDDEGELQDTRMQGGSDVGVAYKGQRSGAGDGAGSGKPQFVSANASRGPSSRRPTQVQALSATAAMADVAPSNAEAAPLADASQISMGALAVLMHLGCMSLCHFDRQVSMLTVERFIDSIQDLSTDSRAGLKKHVKMHDFGALLDADCDELFTEALQDHLPAIFNALERTAVKRALKSPGASQATSTAQLQQDFASVVETMKAWMPMLHAQILQQNYQGSTLASGNSGKRKQEQQAAFKLELYNFYVDKSAKALPTNSSAWSDKCLGTYDFKNFGEFDKAQVLHVRKDAMPYRHALLHHAATAVAFQRSRGMLRDDIEFHSNDFDVVSDVDKKPDIERWLLDAVPINGEG